MNLSYKLIKDVKRNSCLYHFGDQLQGISMVRSISLLITGVGIFSLLINAILLTR